MEDQEEAALAAAARAAAEAALAEDLAAEAHAEAALAAALAALTTDRPIITDRRIFTALISDGAGTDRAITAAVAEAVSVRF